MENKTLIENAIRFIQQNPKENLSLQTIAENAGFSLTYFDALFQKHTGYSPVEYARRYKLTRSALELLWKHSAAVCLQDAALFGNGDAEEDESPLGVRMSEQVGMVKTAKVLRCRK